MGSTKSKEEEVIVNNNAAGGIEHINKHDSINQVQMIVVVLIIIALAQITFYLVKKFMKKTVKTEIARANV